MKTTKTLTNGNKKDTCTGVVLCDDTLGSNWFHFRGVAGIRMATSWVPMPPSEGKVTSPGLTVSNDPLTCK